MDHIESQEKPKDKITKINKSTKKMSNDLTQYDKPEDLTSFSKQNENPEEELNQSKVNENKQTQFTEKKSERNENSVRSDKFSISSQDPKLKLTNSANRYRLSKNELIITEKL